MSWYSLQQPVRRRASFLVFGFAVFGFMLCVSALSLSAGDDKQKDDPQSPQAANDPVPPVDPLHKARVQFLIEATKHFEIRVGEDPQPAKQTTEPVMVYNNPISGTKLGILTVFTRNGRPDVMAQFSFSAPQAVYNEFHNLSNEKVVMKRGSRELWSPPETSTKWQELATDEKPAGTVQTRLAQMRRLTERFSMEDDFGWDKKERHELRILRTPVYRYGKADEPIVDGAVFVYALGTDPEALLLLECVRKESGLAWQYAFGPMSIYALSAKLDGEVVWQIPERKQFGQLTSIQYVSQYGLAPGEKYPE